MNILIIIGIITILITIFLLLWFFLFKNLINDDKCADNMIKSLSITKKQAKCLLQEFKKQNVSKESIKNICKVVKDGSKANYKDFLTNLSVDDIAKLNNASLKCGTENAKT